MRKTLLSICIPTYNRAEYLKKSIDSIVNQDEFINKQVEIVITDNASTDNTENIVTDYANRYENIIYYRNEKNIGNDNFPFVLSKGNGILRRLCNDTLCFKQGALKYMCEIVKKYEATKPFICWLGRGANDIKNLDFKEGIKEASYWMTSIACFSIWHNECNGIQTDTYGTEMLLWQVRKTMELCYEKDNMLLINKVLTFNQIVYNKDISYGLYHVFYENYFTLLNPYFEKNKLTEEDKEYLEKDLLLNFFPDWCAKWKLQNTIFRYSKTEDLCTDIYQQFHLKSYFRKYEKKVKRIYLYLRMKDIIKKVFERG